MFGLRLSKEQQRRKRWRKRGGGAGRQAGGTFISKVFCLYHERFLLAPSARLTPDPWSNTYFLTIPSKSSPSLPFTFSSSHRSRLFRHYGTTRHTYDVFGVLLFRFFPLDCTVHIPQSFDPPKRILTLTANEKEEEEEEEEEESGIRQKRRIGMLACQLPNSWRMRQFLEHVSFPVGNWNKADNGGCTNVGKSLREGLEMRNSCGRVHLRVYVCERACQVRSHFSGIFRIQSLDLSPALPTQLILRSPSCNNTVVLHHGNFTGFKKTRCRADASPAQEWVCAVSPLCTQTNSIQWSYLTCFALSDCLLACWLWLSPDVLETFFTPPSPSLCPAFLLFFYLHTLRFVCPRHVPFARSFSIAFSHFFLSFFFNLSFQRKRTDKTRKFPSSVLQLERQTEWSRQWGMRVFERQIKTREGRMGARKSVSGVEWRRCRSNPSLPSELVWGGESQAASLNTNTYVPICQWVRGKWLETI